MSDDDTPISETNTIFACAYANAIKTKFQLNIGQNSCILTSPATQCGMAAGNLIYPHKFANGLQYSESPRYTGSSAGSSIQQLHRDVLFFFFFDFQIWPLVTVSFYSQLHQLAQTSEK